jgi:hypothetical protein
MSEGTRGFEPRPRRPKGGEGATEGAVRGRGGFSSEPEASAENRIPLSPELAVKNDFWRDVRVVEGVRLEGVCAQKVPGVRIPLSP